LGQTDREVLKKKKFRLRGPDRGDFNAPPEKGEGRASQTAIKGKVNLSTTWLQEAQGEGRRCRLRKEKQTDDEGGGGKKMMGEL